MVVGETTKKNGKGSIIHPNAGKQAIFPLNETRSRKTFISFLPPVPHVNDQHC
jgi:CHASE1-domain containing sensor protein